MGGTQFPKKKSTELADILPVVSQGWHLQGDNL